jgi:hypothetical protein
MFQIFAKSWVAKVLIIKNTSWRKTKKLQIKLTTTCNKNEQQRDTKNNTELETKWTKTT